MGRGWGRRKSARARTHLAAGIRGRCREAHGGLLHLLEPRDVAPQLVDAGLGAVHLPLRLLLLIRLGRRTQERGRALQ